jgi:NAD(P)H-dependent FMN reductase
VSERKVDRLCRKAREHLKRARDPLIDAAYEAGQEGNPELDKALMAVKDSIAAAEGLLIMLPRLKG